MSTLNHVYILLIKKYVIFIHGHMDTSILRKQLEMFVY